MARSTDHGATRAIACLAAIALLFLPTQVLAGPAGLSPQACESAGVWIDPKSGERLPADELFGSLAAGGIVLLGESHASEEHHLWQLHTLAGLYAHRSELVVGFEMFPRGVQPVLDDWSEGRLAEAAFLERSRWHDVWGYDPDLYLPLFHFARQNRLPMAALNVERALVSRVGREGWAAVPQREREGLSDPAPASEAYRRSLAEVYLSKLRARDASPHGGGEAESVGHDGEAHDLSTVMASESFARFVEAQLTWDRAMAEALAAARADHPDALVVGVLGRGHVEFGHGVPHQLADLGEADVVVLLPEDAGEGCEGLAGEIADAVFLLPPIADSEAPPDKPRLGVVIDQTEAGVRITRVIEGSVAEATELAAGDIVRSAAGEAVTRNADLISIVERQAPGTWLPLEIERDGDRLQFVAKFPPESE